MPRREDLETAAPACRHCPRRLEYDLARNLWTCAGQTFTTAGGVRHPHPRVELAGELAGAVYDDFGIALEEPQERAA